MESLEDLEKERRILLEFLSCEAHKGFQADMLEAQRAAEDAVFENVPQTLGDEKQREQQIGLRNFAQATKEWFLDRLTALELCIADKKQETYLSDVTTT